jgi:hypothetical protein
MEQDKQSKKAPGNIKTSPAATPSGLQRRDPDTIFAMGPIAPPVEEETGPMGTARVARGRCLHVPSGKKVVVGSRPIEINGTTVYRDVCTQEIAMFNEGAEVQLPVKEIERLKSLGFLVDDDKRLKALRAQPKPDTGIHNDPRVR